MSGWHVLICGLVSSIGALIFLTVVGRDVGALHKQLAALERQKSTFLDRQREALAAAELAATKASDESNGAAA